MVCAASIVTEGVVHCDHFGRKGHYMGNYVGYEDQFEGINRKNR